MEKLQELIDVLNKTKRNSNFVVDETYLFVYLDPESVEFLIVVNM